MKVLSLGMGQHHVGHSELAGSGGYQFSHRNGVISEFVGCWASDRTANCSVSRTTRLFPTPDSIQLVPGVGEKTYLKNMDFIQAVIPLDTKVID